MAVTGLADPDRLLRNDAGRGRAAADADQAARASACSTAGTRRPARCSAQAVAAMTTLNRDAAAGRARRRGPRAPPTSPASACSATCSSWPGPAASPRWSTPPPCPTWTAPGEALRDGYVSGGTRRNLDWVRPHTDLSAVVRGRAAAARRRADLRRPAGRRRDARRPGHRRVRRPGRTPSSSCADRLAVPRASGSVQKGRPSLDRRPLGYVAAHARCLRLRPCPEGPALRAGGRRAPRARGPRRLDDGAGQGRLAQPPRPVQPAGHRPARRSGCR